ncbi:histidine kinase [Flavobacteriaceae bacterium UJ101]|nr:histidine kinase [Flavobacteriaceae bacterium UJ101]
MKLIKKTYNNALFYLFPFLALGVFFTFYIIEHVNYEETDEYLTYKMGHLKAYYQKNNVLPRFPQSVDRIQYNVKPIQPFFKDTLILETADNEWIPYRELHFTLPHGNQYHKIVLQHVLLGKDDVLEGTFFITIILILAFIIILVIIINTTYTLWNPFTDTLSKIENFDLKKELPHFSETNIDEFQSLNHTLNKLLVKIKSDYNQTKEFNENASHELQTYLSIIRHSHEKLFNSLDNPKTLQEVQKAHSATLKLSQIQKSLLLLSKIRNQEFTQIDTIPLKIIIQETIIQFEELIEFRNIATLIHLEDVTVQMDSGLAQTLITNLIKNAIRHNIQGGYIKIELKNQLLIIENSGLPLNRSSKEMFQRFTKGQQGHLGIGLAIVYEICSFYNYSLDYTNQKEKHFFSLNFSKK